jgi:DNA-binding Lrp family transcriptional regulator
MAIRKAKLGRKIDIAIIEVLQQTKIPISTRDIALRIGRAWNSVQFHCMKMQVNGKITGYKISNLNVWVIKK